MIFQGVEALASRWVREIVDSLGAAQAIAAYCSSVRRWPFGLMAAWLQGNGVPR
jgi:hypothetical protein